MRTPPSPLKLPTHPCRSWNLLSVQRLHPLGNGPPMPECHVLLLRTSEGTRAELRAFTSHISEALPAPRCPLQGEKGKSMHSREFGGLGRLRRGKKDCI